MGKLTVKAVEKLVADGTRGEHGDGEGLYLRVTGNGKASWFYRYVFEGKRTKLGLGSWPTVGLKEARDKRFQEAKKAAQGVNPVEAKAEEKEAKRQQRQQEKTFKVVALDYIKHQRAGWRNKKHGDQWENTLTTYAFPTIGSKRPADITTEDVLDVLRPIWATKPETARRVRNRIEIVLNSAKAMRLIPAESINVAAWRNHLELLLPRQRKISRKHHPALPWRQVPEFWQAIAGHTDLSALAVKLTLLTATRTSEVLLAEWKEFDLNNRLWTIPAERMKAGTIHRVPLSEAAYRVFDRLPRVADSDYLFPGARKGRPLSNMAMLQKVRGMDETSTLEGGAGWRSEEGEVITIHGFRSSFRDWAAENSPHQNFVVEMALAHTVGNAVEAAYRRGDLIEKRRELMNEWAEYVTGEAVTEEDSQTAKNNVIQLKR
ncbi:MAG: integrase arm-type DNA-binding domain-containing protein [Pseudomonadota bacterium]|nr:integrase arm-type DNA-binding domain-containing protein [Pseudomonadota bacterium]